VNVTEAMNQTNALVTDMVARLTPDQRHLATPCDQWTVDDLLAHICGGTQMVAGGLQGQEPPQGAGPSSTPHNLLADGPVAAWAAARAALEAAATPDALEAEHQMPFGEVRGEMAVAVITADALTHAWDLSMATGIDHGISSELATFALEAWLPLVPAEGRTGDGFKAAIEVAADATAIEKLAAFTGREPLP